MQFNFVSTRFRRWYLEHLRESVRPKRLIAQGLLPHCRTGAVLLPRLGVPAWRNDRFRPTACDGVAAGAAVIGAAGGDRLALGDLRQQAGQHGRVADLAVGELERSNLKGPLVDGQVNFAPDAPTRPAMLARVPFALTADLDPCAVPKKVQRPARDPIGQLHRHNLLTTAKRREIWHRPLQPGELQQALHIAHRLPERQTERTFTTRQAWMAASL